MTNLKMEDPIVRLTQIIVFYHNWLNLIECEFQLQHPGQRRQSKLEGFAIVELATALALD